MPGEYKRMPSKRQPTQSKEQYQAKGAFISLDQLLHQRHAARTLALDFHSRNRLGMAGSHISKTKGRGVDFEEHRAYQPGDDIRSIDWRVTARTGRPFTKIFREERERPVMIAVDQGHGMFFGSQVAFKSVVAAEAAAIICWVTVDNGDRVGGVVFNDHQQTFIKPKRGKRSALRFLDTLASYNQSLLQAHQIVDQDQVPPLRKALEQIYRITRPGSNVYVVSDFRTLDSGCLDYLHQLAIHNNVTCVFIYDILEEELPVPGIYSITDGQHKSLISTHSDAVRELYRQDFRNRLALLEAEFTRLKIPLITIRTHQVVLEQLETWKHKIH